MNNSTFIVYRAITRWTTGKFMMLSYDDVPEIGTYLTMTNGSWDEEFKAVSSKTFVDTDGEKFTEMTYEGTLTHVTRKIYFKPPRAAEPKTAY